MFRYRPIAGAGVLAVLVACLPFVESDREEPPPPALTITPTATPRPAVTPSATPEPTDTPTPTPEPTDTAFPPTPIPTDTPLPPAIVTEDGITIVYLGPSQAQSNGTLEVSFQVSGPDGQPAQGTFFATLGDPPTDSRASHANGQLDQEGKISLTLPVNWPAGTTKVFCSFQDNVYEVTEIEIS